MNHIVNKHKYDQIHMLKITESKLCKYMYCSIILTCVSHTLFYLSVYLSIYDPHERFNLIQIHICLYVNIRII